MDEYSLIINTVMLIACVLISALCSMTETALSSANIIRIKAIAKKKNNKAAVRAYHLIRNYSKTLTAILICNNIVNIAASSLATFIFADKFGASGVVYATIIMTIIIVIFGEITPKIIAKENAETVLMKVSGIFKFLVTILTPIALLVELVEEKFKKKKSVTATEDELLEIVQTIEFEGVLKQGERELIQNAVEFDDKKVKDVMLKKDDVVFLYDTSDIETVKNLIINQKYSRIPIVCEKTGRVIGIIHEGDVLDNVLSGKDISINSLLKDALYLTKNRRLSFALEKIQKSRMHMAIVIDNNEDHNFLGIITLEDILEELVGEIYDEYDDLPKNVLKIGLHTFQIEANIKIDDFFDEYLEEVEQPKTASKTFVGWINELSGNHPRLNEEFEYENIKIKIIKMNDKLPVKLEISVSTHFDELEDL